MDKELEEAEECLKIFVRAKNDADDEEARHKHMTAAKIKAYSNEYGVTKAKEYVMATDEWLESQINVNKLKAMEAFRKGQLEAAIRRFEAARSEYAATRRVT